MSTIPCAPCAEPAWDLMALRHFRLRVSTGTYCSYLLDRCRRCCRPT